MAKPTRNFQSAGRGIIAISQTVDEASPISLAPAPADKPQFNRLRAGLVTIAFVRLEEIHFQFGSSFLLPFDFDAGPLKRLMSRHKGAKLAVFGHADPVGSESFNKNLSGRRAAAVYGMLVRNVSLWEKLYFEHDNNGKDEWGVGSIQVMLKRLGFDPSQIDGKSGPATNSALSDFQRSAGLPSTPITANTVDHQTFKVLARAYMDAVCVDRSSERFPKPNPNPDASLAKSGSAPFKLDKTDFIGLGADHDFKADIQGCSEFNPILRFSISEEQEFAKQENFADRNRENQPNRRVMILLFRPGTEVDTTKWPCPSYVQGVAGCKKRFFSDAALRGANGPERRLLKVTNDTFQCRFFQRLHDHSEFQVVSNERLESRFALTQFEGVAHLFSHDDFHIWMLLIFGADIPKDTLDQVHKELLDGAFPNCDIELVKGGIEGHLAAYDRVDKVILIDQSMARAAEKDNKAASELSAALVEEFGHFVDDRMRTELTDIGGDADLDEGAVFGFALVNFKNDIQGEMDIADYTHDGLTHTLKVNYEALKQSTKVFFSEQEQIDDARTEKFEFFGAGPGVNRGQQPGASFGHESIEFILKDVGFTEDKADPVKSELKRIYFGNWLRDFSQVIDPHIVRPPGSTPVSHRFLRANLTKCLDLLSREHFNDNPIFQVTTANLGVYRADEHIDNPKGIVDETARDRDFRNAFDEKEGRIDVSIGLKNYIRTPTITAGKGPLTSLVFMTQELDAAVSLGKTNEGMRRLGAGLHTLEDFFAHSNFVELSLIELGNTAVFPWAGTRISGSPEPVLNGKFPIVTGMFGGSDTAVSFLDILGEHLQNEKPCLLERSTGAKIALILLEDVGESEFSRRLEFIMTKFETFKEKFPGVFTLGCKMAEKILRWVKALVGAAMVQATDGISAAQLEFFNDVTSNNPTHSMLAKDHDDHPLHVMAARMAQAATKDVASRMFQTWSGKALGGNDNPAFVASQYLVHPALLNARSQPGQPPLPPGPKDLWDKMKKESADPGNAPAIKRVEGRKWVQEQLEKADKEQEEIRKRAKEIDPDKARREAEELLKRIKELEQPPPPNV